MLLRTILILGGLVCAVSPARAQLDQASAFLFDSAAPRLFSGNVGAQLSISDKQTNQRTDIVLLGTAKFRYIQQKTEYNFYVRYFWEQKDDGEYARKFTFLFNPSINRYTLNDQGNLASRKLWVQPLLLLNTNSDRGLRFDLDLGPMLCPWYYQNKWFGFTFGLGPVLSYSNWDMYDRGAVAGLALEKQRQIEFINENLSLRQGQYYNFFDIKAMLYVATLLKITKGLQVSIAGYAQQGFLNPYNSTITDRYSELKKKYPHIVGELNATVAVFKNIGLKLSFRADYQKSLLVLYQSNFEYYTMVGLAWRFQKSFHARNKEKN